ncbi:MAG TPA: PBP1A family penicillin-binding protein, partial [Vicinamibacterales bacterium]
ALLGVVSGVLFAYAGDLPRVTALDDYAPSTITRVYAAGGEVVGQFATERRMVVGYDDIAPQLRQAIISAEDAGFDSHVGLSMSRILITLVRDVFDGMRDMFAGRSSRPAGASTLTQQLARNLFPEDIGFQVSVERKIKEAIVAVQIEKRYTKREILTFYANHIPFGHGTYGVESAARLYFGKSAKDVSLEEAALLAGIVQRPARQNPFVDVAAATRRRNYALQRMADEGYLSQQEADIAKQKPVLVKGQPRPERSEAPFFVEEIRKHLEQRFGAKQLYESGLSVWSSLDLPLQRAANRAVDRGLRKLDQRRGYRRSAVKNILADGQRLDRYRHERWDRPMAAGDIVPGLVTAVTPTSAQIRLGVYRGELGRADFTWTHRTAATDLFKPGDLIEVSITSLNESSRTAALALEQTPLVEGALVAIDNRTGQIKAMVGGFSFERSKFNRAVQAYRQVGSGFKPFVYTAAIDRGFTPVSTLTDEPMSFPAGPGQPPYAPKNYDGVYEGTITLRHALEDSRNVPAVWMMNQLGPAQVVSYARRFGLTGTLQPFLSTALGAGEGSLVEMTSAYSVFANQGIRMTPYSILKVSDREGNVLEENRPESHDAIRADTAFVMTNLLRGVIQRGTGAQAAALKWPLGGKTGTTDDNSDAWFLGFDPDMTVGVWVGHDERKPLGPSETGAVAALPIWIEFMQAYLAGKDRDNPPQFARPSNIVFLTMDGSRTSPVSGASQVTDVGEAFISGTEPQPNPWPTSPPAPQ